VSGELGFFLQDEVPVELVDRDFVISLGGAIFGYFEDTDAEDSLSARRGKTQPGRGK
jgi:hypothetical protein